MILSKIAEAAKPGTLLINGEYLLNENKTGPRHVVRANLNMLVAARGRERTEEEYRTWMDCHGFTLVRKQMTDTQRAFLVARKR